jgi:tetratricopeptide (TPR) repeat protein
MRPAFRLLLIVTFAMVLLPGVSAAQAWRGQGRVAGKVVDESRKPVEGVTVKAYLPEAEGGTQVKSNKSGEWAVSGIGRGMWQLDFAKEGFESRQVTVAVSEVSRLPPMEIALKRAVPVIDPNVEIKEGLVKAAELMNTKKFADARAIYEALIGKYPEAWQIQPLIARTYYAENQFDKAIEHLRLGLAKDPENIEIKLLLANVLVEKGDAEEGKQLIASIDETRVKDPLTFVNVGIAMINQNKPADALVYFDKAIARFPEHADAYYYRGITHLQMGKPTEAKADLSAVALAKPDLSAVALAKADLTKFLQLAPNAPEAAMARKILEQLK